MHGIYRMTKAELLASANRAAERGCPSVFTAICAELARRDERPDVPAPAVVHVPLMTDSGHAVAA